MSTARLRLLVLLATIVLLFAIALAAGLVVLHLRSSFRNQSAAAVERIAHAAEVTVNRHLLQVDGALAALPTLLAQQGRPLPAPAAATELLRHLNAYNFAFGDLILAHPDGAPWAAALPTYASRPLPTAVVAAARPGVLAVAGPVQNPATAEWGLYLVRLVRLPSAGPMLAVAELPLPLLDAGLAPLATLPGLVLTLEQSDGPVLAQVPHGEGMIGRVPARRSVAPAPNGIAALGPGPEGEGIQAVRQTLYSDLIVSARLSLAVAEREVSRDRDRLLAAAAGAALLLLALGLALSSWLDQREQLEVERTRARSLLFNAVESMTDGFVMFDADDRLVLCNQRYREMYAATGDAIQPGASFEEIVRAGVARGQYPQAAGQEEAFVVDLVAWHRRDLPPRERLLPDGRWILVNERPTPDGGIVGIRTDVTALKAANAALATARDAAAAAAAAKTRFLARMSHELRTPLNGVLGIAQAMARDTALGPEHRRQAATLEMAGRHLVAVANDVLDLAHVETGQLALRPEPLALAGLLTDCVTITQPAASARGQVVQLQQRGELPAGVLADATRLRQLVLNLLSNAVKFSPDGAIVILRATATGPADATGRLPLRIEVRDTGPGVPEEAREAVFGDFVRLAGDHRQEGAGLGLAIARHVAGCMGGQLRCIANAEAPSGAVFVLDVALPPAVPEAAAALPAPAPTVPRRLLVADDVPANLAVVRALLDSLGHDVVTVADGAQAVRAVMAAAEAGEPFDAVLMDMMMPVLDGIAATRRIRALPSPASATPVIAVSASIFPDDIAACRAAGMDGHLAKPIEREALLAVLRQLGRAEAPAAPDAASATMPAAPPEQAVPEHPLLERRGGRVALAVPGLDPAMARDLLPGFVEEIALGLERLGTAGDAQLTAEARQLAANAAMLGARRLEQAAAALAEAPGPAALERAMAAGRATLTTLRAELGETV